MDCNLICIRNIAYTVIVCACCLDIAWVGDLIYNVVMPPLKICYVNEAWKLQIFLIAILNETVENYLKK